LEGAPQEVKGTFNCSNNNLKTLTGAPKLVNGDFFCDRNQLKTLEGAPQEIKGGFSCRNNLLETLESGPTEVGSYYDCAYNQLNSLKGMPNIINGTFLCSNNRLTSLAGCGQIIKEDFVCTDNKLLTSIDGAPSFVAGSVFLQDCPKLTSLQNIHNHFSEVHGQFYINRANIKEHILGLLLIRKLQGIVLDDPKLERILCKYLKGRGNPLSCALELVEAGYEEYAKL
jgi:hypothetical protein